MQAGIQQIMASRPPPPGAAGTDEATSEQRPPPGAAGTDEATSEQRPAPKKKRKRGPEPRRYTIHRAVDMRGDDGEDGMPTEMGLELKIRWQGWGPDDDTWEPVEHL